jgi:hypothetical protein
MDVGLAFESPVAGLSMEWTRVYVNGVVLATLGCGLEGKLLPLVTLCLLLPPTPRRLPVEGEELCGGALTAQTLTVPSADPETSSSLSGPPKLLL